MPDILIGNVRGPQGETGPANTLLASVYQFCASDTGATIPQDGAWTSGVPQIEKGKYIWCRNTLTWNSGPETILYSVGYVGYDGEFNGIELVDQLGNRVQALEDRVTPISKGGTESSTIEGAQAKLGITALKDALAKVNDCTTGVNLLRGTRDFRIGTELYGNQNSYYVDGFRNASSTPFTFSKDADGFTVASCKSSSSELHCPIFPVSNGETITISFDVKLDNPTEWTSTYIAILGIYDASNARVQFVDLTPSVLGISFDKAGEWKHVSYNFKVSNAAAVYGALRLQSRYNGSFHFKKPCVYEGDFEYAIYSQSPFDFASSYLWNENTLVSEVGKEGKIFSNRHSQLDVLWYSGNLSYSSVNSSDTGSIKIVLPTPVTELCMLRFRVSIYDFNSNALCDFFIQGYVYSADSNWHISYCSAYSICPPNYRNRNARVKFGKTSSGNPAIEIGDSSTTWGYLKIVVSEIMTTYPPLNEKANEWQITVGGSVVVSDVVKTIETPYILSSIEQRMATLEAKLA